MLTLKIYILGVFFKVKFKLTHKKLYFSLEFIEENCKTGKFEQFLTVKQRNLEKQPLRLQRNLSFLPWGVYIFRYFNTPWGCLWSHFCKKYFNSFLLINLTYKKLITEQTQCQRITFFPKSIIHIHHITATF